MDFIYDRRGASMGFVQRDGNSTRAFGKGGEFLGWSDDESVYLHDGSLLARGGNGIGLLFETQHDSD